MIHALMLRDFMGVEVVEYRFGPRGGIVEGANGSGKTTVLKAIRAGLAAQGIGPDAIRVGAEAAEILIDLGDVAVRRAITQSGSTLTVSVDGVRRSSPQTFLHALLGTSPLDPLDLFLERDARKRSARILQALPVSLTMEQLGRWVPPDVSIGGVLGRLPDGAPDLSGHGLEVLSRLRRALADQRTGVGREHEAAERELDVALARVGAARADVMRCAGNDTVPATVEEAEAQRAAALQDVANVRARRQAAAQAAERSGAARARVAQLREDASGLRRKAAALAVTPGQRDAALEAQAHAEGMRVVADEEVTRLREQLRRAEETAGYALQAVLDARGKVAQLEAGEANAQEANDAAIERESQAAELEAAAGGADPGPTPGEDATCVAAADRAERLLLAAQHQRTLARLTVERDAVNARLTAHAERYAQLGETVKRLRDDAPAALLTAAGGAIAGLTLEGDDVLLDGVALDRLSGASAMQFAVEIARRLNAKSKLIVVDGLERLDAEQLPAFVEAATRDGYQLIATRVASGPAHVVEPGGAA